MAHISINTREYFRSHLTQPKGRGGWMFQIGTHMPTFCGTYTDAKKQAVAFAKAHNISEVVVLP